MMRQKSTWEYQQFLHNLSLCTVSSGVSKETVSSRSPVPSSQRNLLLPHTASSPEKGSSGHSIPIHPRLLAFSSHLLLWAPPQLPLPPNPGPALPLRISWFGASLYLPFPKVQQSCSLSSSLCLELTLPTQAPGYPPPYHLAASFPMRGSSPYLNHHTHDEVWRNLVASQLPTPIH